MQNKLNTQSQWLRYLGLTAQLLVAIGLALFAGIKGDEWLSLSPLLTIALPLLVLTITFYKLIRDLSKRKKDESS